MAASENVQSYIDTDTILSDSFSSTSFANSLVTSTNNASDTVVDLSTPLSRVLFDVQEIDTNLHNLSTGSALPLLSHARKQTASAQSVLTDLESHVERLKIRYAQLDEDVVQRHAVAEEVRLAASRLWVTVKIGRAVQRALLLGRQLDANMEEAMRLGAMKAAPGSGDSKGSESRAGGGAGSDEAAALLRAANSILSLKSLLSSSAPGEEGEHLSRINIVATLRTDLLAPAESKLRGRAQQIVREFSLSSVSGDANTAPAAGRAATPPTNIANITYAQSTSTRARTAAAAQVLYLVSPAPASKRASDFTPSLMLTACEAYLRACLTASSSSLGRALAALSTLPRVLAEVSARCQNVAALEKLLAGVECPEHALLRYDGEANGEAYAEPKAEVHASANANPTSPATKQSLLAPLLDSLDTSSLPSYFWRSLAPDVGQRVSDLLGRGGVGARQLRGSKERLKDSLKEAVLRGCEGAMADSQAGGKAKGKWEREVGVMVGSVLGPMAR
jgi:Golgi transport complex subunit 5